MLYSLAMWPYVSVTVTFHRSFIHEKDFFLHFGVSKSYNIAENTVLAAVHARSAQTVYMYIDIIFANLYHSSS